MVVLPPGTILQLMYLRERLRLLRPGFFVEVGPGSGEITKLLLQLGWSGRAYEIAGDTAEKLRQRFASEVAQGRLSVEGSSYLESRGARDTDLVISCMVMEHLSETEQVAFMEVAQRHLRPGGCMIGIVPASPEHWGVEDEIAGHRRRYTRSLLQALAAGTHWRIAHVAGLTFPVSNLLLPLSNALVARKEQAKLQLSKLERTKQSGIRDVGFKTHFPAVLRFLLNEVVMWPLHGLQKWMSGSRRALVIYFEARPEAPEENQGAPAWQTS